MDPRLCAANTFSNLFSKPSPGGSPPLRGKQHRSGDKTDSGWWIPAFAGQTWSFIVQPYSPGADPRICGANTETARRAVFRAGGSPHLRGKLVCFLQGPAITGWIPAFAGQTIKLLRACLAFKVDPRLCGANQASQGWQGIVLGGSPPLRGKRRLLGRPGAQLWWIPAFAGQTGGHRF